MDAAAPQAVVTLAKRRAWKARSASTVARNARRKTAPASAPLKRDPFTRGG